MYKCHVDTCFVQFIFQLLKYIFHFFLKMSLLDKNKIAPKKQVGFQKALLIKKGKKGAVWVKNNYFFVPVVHLTTISKHVTLSLSFWLGRLHCTTFSFSFLFLLGGGKVKDGSYRSTLPKKFYFRKTCLTRSAPRVFLVEYY